MERLGAKWKKSQKVGSRRFGSTNRSVAVNREVEQEKVKTGLSGAQTGDFRKGQHRSRGNNERKDQALMGEREFSGAAARDSHLCTPVTPGESRAELLSLLTKECLSPTVIDPRQRGCPQAAAVVVKGIAVPIEGMVEVGVIPETGTETFTGGEKGCQTKGKGFPKGTNLFSACRERGLQQMGSICYVNSLEPGKAITMCCKKCPGAGQVFTPGFSYC